MTLTLHRESTLQPTRPAPELKQTPSLTDSPARPPTRRRRLAPAGLVAAAALAIGGVALVQQRDDPEQVQPAPEYRADTYAPSGAMLDHGVLDGVYAIPDTARLSNTYVPERGLSNDVLDGVYVIPEATWPRYDTYTTPGMLLTAGMVDGIYDPAELSQPPLVSDAHSGKLPQPGRPDGEWVRPQAPIYPCRISGPC